MRCLNDGQVYAIKTIPLQAAKVKLLSGSDQIRENEVEIMKDLHHLNIIHMFGSFVDVDFSSNGSKEKPTQNPLKIKQELIDFNNDKEEKDSLPPTREGVFDKEE